MERDTFGLPIKKTNSARGSEKVTTIKMNQPPRLLSAPAPVRKKAINPFTDPIPPKPRNPFDDDNDEHGSSNIPLSEIFSSTHSYQQLSTHGIPADGNSPAPPGAVAGAAGATDPDVEMNGEEEDGDDDVEVDGPSNSYRLSQERQSSRKSFRGVIQKAERNMFKRGHGETIVCVDKNDDNAVIRFLLSQRMYGYPGTDGTFFENYYGFVINQHPLIGLVCHHKLHPFRTGPRIAIFLCLLGFSFAISVALLNDFYFEEQFICTAGCDTDYVQNISTNKTTEICVGGENDGMEYEDYREHCQYFHPWVISLGAAAIICPYGTLLKFLATCHCVQGRKFFQTNCCGRGIKNLVEYVGGRVLLIFIVFNAILFILALYYAYVVMRMYTVLYTFILSKLFSYLYWFGWTGPYFSYKYPIDQKLFYKELRKQNRSTSQTNLSESKDEIEIGRINSGSNLLK